MNRLPKRARWARVARHPFSVCTIALGAAVLLIASLPSAHGRNPALETVDPSSAGGEEYSYARPMAGVQCDMCPPGSGELTWRAMRPIPWEIFAQGEYIGPARTRQVPIYRLRTDDVLDFVFRLTRQPSKSAYRFDVGDEIKVDVVVGEDRTMEHQLLVQPDGAITLQFLGQVPAANRTVDELRDDLVQQYKKYLKDPQITVTPVKINTRLEEMRAAVDRRFGAGGQSQESRVTPEGTIQLPAIGSVPAQGLSLDELKREVDARYGQLVKGLEVTPILVERAPRFIYVVGEVRQPGRFTMVGPTTVMQAIAMSGSWNVGANLNQIVVFRRDENWQLMATKLDIRGALYGKRPCPADEIWLRDSDVVVVPKSPVLVADDVIDLVFTRGIYGVFPMSTTINFAKLSTL